jgi:hypothetical protein
MTSLSILSHNIKPSGKGTQGIVAGHTDLRRSALPQGSTAKPNDNPPGLQVADLPTRTASLCGTNLLYSHRRDRYPGVESWPLSPPGVSVFQRGIKNAENKTEFSAMTGSVAG